MSRNYHHKNDSQNFQVKKSGNKRPKQSPIQIEYQRKKTFEVEQALEAQRQKYSCDQEINHENEKSHTDRHPATPDSTNTGSKRHYLPGYIYDNITDRYYRKDENLDRSLKINSVAKRNPLSSDTAKLDKIYVNSSSMSGNKFRSGGKVLNLLQQLQSYSMRHSHSLTANGHALFDPLILSLVKFQQIPFSNAINLRNPHMSFHPFGLTMSSNDEIIQISIKQPMQRLLSVSPNQTINRISWSPRFTNTCDQKSVLAMMTGRYDTTNTYLDFYRFSSMNPVDGIYRLPLHSLERNNLTWSLDWKVGLGQESNQELYLSTESGLFLFNLHLQRTFLKFQSNKHSPPVTTSSSRMNPEIAYIGFRNGQVHLFDGRMGDRLTSAPFASMPFKIDHVDTVFSETGAVCMDIVGNLSIFDLRRPGAPLRQLHSSPTDRQIIRNRKFWISSDERLLACGVDGPGHQITEGDRIDSGAGGSYIKIWNIDNSNSVGGTSICHPILGPRKDGRAVPIDSRVTVAPRNDFCYNVDKSLNGLYGCVVAGNATNADSDTCSALVQGTFFC